MQCPNCEKIVSENARFCDQCGHALEMPAQVVTDRSLDPVESNVQTPDDYRVAAEEQVMGNDPLPTIEPAESESMHMSVEEEVDQPVGIELGEPESIAVSSVAPTDELLSAGPRLVLKDDQGETDYPLSADHAIIVGREDPIDGIFPDIDLTPYDTDTGVSRQHASLHGQGGQWFIQDLASTNYTIVNRRRLTLHEDFLLEDGDVLRFGRVLAEFKLS